MGATSTLRTRDGKQVALTDNGNEILDCRFRGGFADAAALERALDEIPGVVESGLFVGLCHVAVIGGDDGHVVTRQRHSPG
jgi:ribose 5-phosphate isomerase A